MSEGHLTVYVDGASRGNPGRAAIGVVVCDANGEVVARVGEYIGRTTNNVAEYMALIFGMQEALLRGASELTVRTDSELVVKQVSGAYRTRDEGLKVLGKLVRHLQQGFSQFRVEHVSREDNKEADLLAGQAIEEVE